MKFSEKVKYARMKLLLTQEALAKELGVSYATICRWEKIIVNRKSYRKANFTRSATKVLSLRNKGNRYVYKQET
ncbi:MAG: helix-turn-helix transcriptional regulator [Eubacterium sp.]